MDPSQDPVKRKAHSARMPTHPHPHLVFYQKRIEGKREPLITSFTIFDWKGSIKYGSRTRRNTKSKKDRAAGDVKQALPVFGLYCGAQPLPHCTSLFCALGYPIGHSGLITSILYSCSSILCLFGRSNRNKNIFDRDCNFFRRSVTEMLEKRKRELAV